MTDKEIRKKVMLKYPRTEKEIQGCPTEMERMYKLRKEYRNELENKINESISIQTGELNSGG